MQYVTGVATTPAYVVAACGKPLTMFFSIKNTSYVSIRPTPYIAEEILSYDYPYMWKPPNHVKRLIDR